MKIMAHSLAFFSLDVRETYILRLQNKRYTLDIHYILSD